MIRIMIVDDMPIFLEYLRGCIDWQAYGFEICCEAHDGKEAGDKIGEFYPDIVLTDITMPYLNGLELAQKIGEQYPDIAVILITGNNEFEYARRAVKIGVCDYIVKPFEKEELIISLLKLQDNMNRAIESEHDDTLKEREKIEEAARYLIYSGDRSRDEAALGRLGMKHENFLVCTVKMGLDTAIPLEQLMNWENLIAGLLQEMIQIDGSYAVFRDYESNIVILLNFDTAAGMQGYRGYELTDLIQILENQLNIACGIAISDNCLKEEDIRGAYYQALQTLAVKDPGQVWDCRKREYNLGLERSEAPAYSLDMVYELNKELEFLQADKAAETITRAWDLVTAHESSTFSGMNLASGLISILMTNIINAGLSLDAIYGKNFSPDRFIGENSDPVGRRNALIDLYRKRIDFEKSKSDSREHDVAEGAVEYIGQHYMEPGLSISEISEALLVNQTYLRRMFKSQMNMTLSEYLIKHRMQKARELITTTDSKLAEVAAMCGYNDVSYFSNAFKKFYGVSPRSLSRIAQE